MAEMTDAARAALIEQMRPLFADPVCALFNGDERLTDWQPYRPGVQNDIAVTSKMTATEVRIHNGQGMHVWTVTFWPWADRVLRPGEAVYVNFPDRDDPFVPENLGARLWGAA